MITRKKFLQLTSLTLAYSMIPNRLFAATSAMNNPTTEMLVKNAADLRKAGKLWKAKNIYLQIINDNPQEIRAYDGLRKVILAKKKQEFEVIKIFRNAAHLHPNNIEIKQRLHNEYFKAAIGNRKVSNQIGINTRLLLVVKEKYENILQNYPYRKNIKKQLVKIDRSIAWNADILNPHNNTNLKLYRKQQQQLFKKRFASLSTFQLNEQLSQLLAKPVSEDRKQHIRELYKLNVQQHRKDKNYESALDMAISFYNTVNKSDPYFLKHIRDLSKQLSNYDLLIAVERQNHALKNNFWSAEALFDALIIKYERGDLSLSYELDNLLNKMKISVGDPSQKFELTTRIVKLLLLKNNLDEAKSILLDITNDKAGTVSPHSIDRLNVLWAKYFVKKGDSNTKNKILTIAQSPRNYGHESDKILKSILVMNINRSFEKSIHIENLQKILSKIG
ncbi:tetratricopeptide repeat protein [Kaistella sp.]|uniref:tetratricopeptide repeat protein n=1 Tax=Kaistella sp. TaxID=2782235 RepID=UPI003C69E663